MRKKETPTLNLLINQGAVWIEGSEYVGKASDGAIVALGHKDEPETAESFLSRRPTPDCW